MPILPLIDLLILLGSGSLLVGFLLRAVAAATIYRPTLFGLSSLDFAVITAVCFGLALTLVARTWLKLNEPSLLALQSRLRAEAAHRRVHGAEASQHVDAAEDEAGSVPAAATVGTRKSA